MPQEVCNIRTAASFWERGARWVLALAANLLGVDAGASETDEQLAKDMQAGDDRAFERLYERYFDRVFAFVLRRVGNKPVAEDLVSEIFIKAFTHRRAFVWKNLPAGGQSSFSAWIYRIATNRITDHYRTRKPSEPFDETQHDQPDGQESPPEEIDRRILGKRLETVLERLGERERIAVTMKFYSECDNQEIAQALHCSANNAGVILHRALKKCKELYVSLE